MTKEKRGSDKDKIWQICGPKKTSDSPDKLHWALCHVALVWHNQDNKRKPPFIVRISCRNVCVFSTSPVSSLQPIRSLLNYWACEYFLYSGKRSNIFHSLSLSFPLSLSQVWWAASDLGWVVGHSYICYAPLLHGNTTIIYEVIIYLVSPLLTCELWTSHNQSFYCQRHCGKKWVCVGG